MTDLQKICAETEKIAREAGEFIRREAIGFDPGKAESKGLNNFVSYVDKGSEEIIVKRLTALLPEAGFLTEEDTISKKGAKYCWVVDPLDGTTNFMHGLPPYAVSIGLMDGNDYVVGVVYEINGDEMFTAWKNGGAWLNGKRIHVTKVSKLADSLVATGFPYTNFSLLGKFMDCFSWFCQNTHGVRRLGSAATDISYIACGRFEAFYEYGLHPWDIAAGIVILKEAGGKVSDFSGNVKDLTGDEIVAAGNAVFPEILEIVNKFMKQ